LKDRWQENYPGKMLQIDLQKGGMAEARVFATRRRVYVASVQVPARDAESGEISRFLDSFKLGSAAVQKITKTGVSGAMMGGGGGGGGSGGERPAFRRRAWGCRAKEPAGVGVDWLPPRPGRRSHHAGPVRQGRAALSPCLSCL